MIERGEAEDYFIQYIFCCMERSLLRRESRLLYDHLFTIWVKIWEGLEKYNGEDKIKLCGDMFKSKITKEAPVKRRKNNAKNN